MRNRVTLRSQPSIALIGATNQARGLTRISLRSIRATPLIRWRFARGRAVDSAFLPREASRFSLAWPFGQGLSFNGLVSQAFAVWVVVRLVRTRVPARIVVRTLSFSRRWLAIRWVADLRARVRANAGGFAGRACRSFETNSIGFRFLRHLRG